jgi:hypothetical protein
MIAEQ